MNEELEDELHECNTLNEMWMTLDDHYDLDKPLRPITKNVIVTNFLNNFEKMIKVTRTPEREDAEE